MAFDPQVSVADINGQQYHLLEFYYPGYNTAWDNYYQGEFLGNFWVNSLTLTIDSTSATFHTAEAAFQATKWWYHPNILKQFEQALTGDDAFRIKKHLTVPADYSYAGLGRDGAMMAVVTSKFNDPVLKAGLLATQDAYLLEHNSKTGRDHYWSDDHDGSGQNMLGITLMKLRETLGGSASPYTGPVVEMTKNVKTNSINTMSMKDTTIKIIPSVFKGGGQDGDFGWMIVQPQYKTSFFIFNDNVSQFKAHQKDPSDPNGCSVGGGNAVIRPYQCQNPPKAGGIPTGPAFSGLTADVKALVDEAINSIKQHVISGGYDSVVYSSDGHGGLGTGIFTVPDDVKKYIVTQIETLKNC